jgi:hypothetical protein
MRCLLWVNVRRGDHLDRLIPRRADKAPLAPLALVDRRSLRVLDNLLPRVNRVAEALPGLAEHLQQAAPDVRVLQPQRRVRVPRKRRPPRAATRLVLRHLRTSRRIVGRLRLPGDQPLLHVHIPRARPRAIHAVRGTHHLRAASAHDTSAPNRAPSRPADSSPPPTPAHDAKNGAPRATGLSTQPRTRSSSVTLMPGSVDVVGFTEPAQRLTLELSRASRGVPPPRAKDYAVSSGRRLPPATSRQ